MVVALPGTKPPKRFVIDHDDDVACCLKGNDVDVDGVTMVSTCNGTIPAST